MVKCLKSNYAQSETLVPRTVHPSAKDGEALEAGLKAAMAVR